MSRTEVGDDLVSSELGRMPAMAILRAPDASRFAAVSRALLDADVRLLEYTLTTRHAVDEVARARAEFQDDAIVGVGTVLTVQQVDASVAAGAQFIVSPVAKTDVIARAIHLGVPVFPGALTPSEILTAWELGATAVKISPVSAVGGAGYLSAVKSFLPEIALMPTGGIQLGDIPAYLDAGAIAVGLSGAELKQALAGTLSPADLTVALTVALQGIGAR